MFSGKDAANPTYPTQWALNPTAYQNVDSNSVDWAALAQQWIAMKEAAAIIAVPPPPSIKPDAEEGEAPMEVENPEPHTEGPGPPPGAEWNPATNSWGGNQWNQWGWGWSGSGGPDPKMPPDPSQPMGPVIDGYSVPADNAPPMPGYTTGPGPTFQHGYWTAPQADASAQRNNNRNRERRSKSKTREQKPVRIRPQREKPPLIPPVIEPVVMPSPVAPPTIDAAKRRQLPAWIREGLEKMEREKQRAIEREQEMKAREEAEKEKKRLEDEELERMKAAAGGEPVAPPKSKFETDSEGESDKEEESVQPPSPPRDPTPVEIQSSPVERDPSPELVKKSKEEIMQEVMMTVRRSLTEILLEVTDQEIDMVSQEELARYTAAQASRLNAMKASKSKALAAIASGLGLGAYESSSDESADEEDVKDITDQQLQDIIRRRKTDFERTSREIDAEVRRAEQKETTEDATTPVATPERPARSRSSATPPPVDSDTPEKVPERRVSKEKRNNHKPIDKVDGIRKLETVPEEYVKKAKGNHTPSPQKNNNRTNKKETSSSSSSDSEGYSSSSSSSTSIGSVPEIKVETKPIKKRKRKDSCSTDSQKISKREKHKNEKLHKTDDKNSHSRSKYYDNYERSDKTKSKRKDDYYDRHKSSRSREYVRSHKDKYREDSEDDRPKKRSKRSRSISYESRSGRRKSTRDRSMERSHRRERRSHDRDRSYEKSVRGEYDRYERSRDYERRRSRSASRSRHRR